MLPIQRKWLSDEQARYHLFLLGLFLPLFWRWFERAGRTACLLDRHYRGKYNIRSADSVVGDSGSQDRE